MSNHPLLLPLFPLEVVLFPGASLPLHIFEPRYRKLIGGCLDNKTEFGVVLMRENEMAEVGCTARIKDLVKRYDDGRLDIVTEGVRRFEIITENSEEEVLRAEVSFFDDEEAEDPDEVRRLSESVKASYAKIVLAVAKPNTNLTMVDAKAPRLAFSVAEHLGLPLEVCQNLLGMRSETKRLAELERYLEELLPKIEHFQKAKTRVGGNGHLT
ncbi:MAG: LON peptidase substrate-binding domain-containing protein [Acidobacteriia bacterium]|nr:LON peptidase substrate-binding domain-containing protein [Terriglobia bacterium]